MQLTRVFAVFFALLALSNLSKPLGAGAEQGFVFLGRRLEGVPNWIAAWSFAVFLFEYARALWREKSSALPMGVAYAAYVSANLFLFWLRLPADLSDNARLFGIAYTAFALAGAWGGVAVMVRGGFAARDSVPGRVALRACALLFALMALSNVLKPFAYTETVGFVLLGQRLSGTANTVAALAFAGFLGLYAWSIWTERRRALPLGILYAAYVVANLVLWNFRKPEGTVTPLAFAVPYLVAAVGVSSGAVWLLWRERGRLHA